MAGWEKGPFAAFSLLVWAVLHWTLEVSTGQLGQPWQLAPYNWSITFLYNWSITFLLQLNWSGQAGVHTQTGSEG